MCLAAKLSCHAVHLLRVYGTLKKKKKEQMDAVALEDLFAKVVKSLSFKPCVFTFNYTTPCMSEVVRFPLSSFSLSSFLSFSYTMRSEVKQAALQRVCSSLTLRLQSSPMQAGRRGRGGGRGGGRRSEFSEAFSSKDGLHRFMLACTVTGLFMAGS